MSKSVGITLTATGISVGNEWLQDPTGLPNFRVAAAGLALALLFDGLEKINERAGVGLATIFLVTVLVTPFKGKSPVQELAAVSGPTSKVL